ncbi:uncharacterized protein LOC109841897 [Asparagus officinalis]|uniref:uncharacterized protein LOC109841897 n=1 Tax=Asparagus officinalis TaxID=4686 RepID=UPI00098E18B3|nr:uncharacterized protein LOC109841897 [Asparagus officinalis]
MDPSMQRSTTSIRVYVVVLCDHGVSEAVVEGTFLVNSFPASILFDSRALHSFISYAFMTRLQLVAQPLDIPLLDSTPLGEVSLLESICRRCIISLDDSEFVINLIVLHMFEFNVILGMDWLSSYHISIDYFVKTVSLKASDGTDLVIVTLQGN